MPYITKYNKYNYYLIHTKVMKFPPVSSRENFFVSLLVTVFLTIYNRHETAFLRNDKEMTERERERENPRTVEEGQLSLDTDYLPQHNSFITEYGRLRYSVSQNRQSPKTSKDASVMILIT